MCPASMRHRFDSDYFQMYKTLMKEKQSRFSFERTELDKIILKYMMIQAINLHLPDDPETFLEVKDILRELYNFMPRSASLGRSMNICPFTGRTRGYYNFSKLSRMQFKHLARGGII